MQYPSFDPAQECLLYVIHLSPFVLSTINKASKWSEKQWNLSIAASQTLFSTHCHTETQIGRHTIIPVFCPFYAASTVLHTSTPQNDDVMMIRSLSTTYFFRGRNTIVIETANTSLPLAQSSCFRGGFIACHKTSCIVNSAASMADWWAICLVDCLAPGPWSYVYVWALLFHMYRPPDHFLLPPPPRFLPCRTDDIHT